jgi:hypothetical protein
MHNVHLSSKYEWCHYPQDFLAHQACYIKGVNCPVWMAAITPRTSWLTRRAMSREWTVQYEWLPLPPGLPGLPGVLRQGSELSSMNGCHHPQDILAHQACHVKGVNCPVWMAAITPRTSWLTRRVTSREWTVQYEWLPSPPGLPGSPGVLCQGSELSSMNGCHHPQDFLAYQACHQFQSVVYIREVDYFVFPTWLHSYQRSTYQIKADKSTVCSMHWSL